jgi:hypothetical protein
MPLTRSEQARLNGAKSNGPTSIEGKLRSSRNNVRHGLAADHVVVLQNELPDAFDRVYTAFAEKFKPQDDAERELVLQAAAARWRLRRIWQLETTLFDLKMDEQRDLMRDTFERFDEHTRQAVAFRSLADDTRSFTLLSRYETRISREYDRAIRALDRLRKERESEPGPDPEPPQQKFPDEPKPAGALKVITLLPKPEPEPQTAHPLPPAQQSRFKYPAQTRPALHRTLLHTTVPHTTVPLPRAA